MSSTKLARRLNQNTLMWEFADKSGVAIPDEVMSEIEYYQKLSTQGVLGAGAAALGLLFSYKEKMQPTLTSIE